MVANISLQGYGVPNVTYTAVTLDTTTTTTSCLNSSTPAYDHNGAMRFTIAVVLVYGIGVIGVLGIYVRRKPSENLEREANVFVRGLGKYRDELAKKNQLSAVQKFIDSIHGERWRYTPSNSAASTPLVSPEVGQARMSFKANGLDSRSVGSPCSPGVPLLTSHRRPGMFLGLASHTVDRQDSIPETEEEDEEYSCSGVTDTPGSDCSLTRPAFTLRMPPVWSRRHHSVSNNVHVHTQRGDNSSSNMSSPDDKTEVESEIHLDMSANESESSPPSYCKQKGRFTVVDVRDV